MNGYYITVQNKGYFIQTDSKRKTSDIVHRMIARIAAEKRLCPEWIDRIVMDKECNDRIRKDMIPAVLDKVDGHYEINNKNMSIHFPQDEKDKSYIIFS